MIATKAQLQRRIKRQDRTIAALRGEIFRILTAKPPCQHTNYGTHVEDGAMVHSCIDCGKVLYRGRGGPSPDDPAYGM